MTKKHYIEFANAIRQSYHPECQDMIRAICSVLKADNPRFNKDRFMDAAVPTVYIEDDDIQN